MLKSNVVGQRLQLGLIAQRLLGIGAGAGAGGVDAISFFHPLDACPDGRDHTARVGARRVGKIRFRGVGAGADVGVHRIHSRSMNANHNLHWPGLRIGHFFQLHHFGTAELVYTYGFHDFLL